MLWTHHHAGSWCNRNSISACKMSPCSNCKAFSLCDLRGPISGNQETLRDDTFEPGGPPHFGTWQVPKCQYPLLPARLNLSVKSHGLVISPPNQTLFFEFALCRSIAPQSAYDYR